MLKIVSKSSCEMDFINDKKDKFFWLFKDDSIKKISCFYSIGNSTTNEFVFAYNFDKKYRFIIREVSIFNNFLLTDISEKKSSFQESVDFDVATDFKLGIGPIVNMQSKMCLTRIHRLKINFGSIDSVQKTVEKNSIIYKGKFSQFGITDENDEYQMFTTFKEAYSPESALILFKKADSFYIILVNSVNSKYPIDNAIELLNLN